MGYTTYFNLEMENYTDEQRLAIAELVEENDFPMDWYNGNDYWDGEGKWYEHQEDMINLSKQFPEVLFILSGEGEDREDNWREYYRNGKVAISWGRIVYDDVDIP